MLASRRLDNKRYEILERIAARCETEPTGEIPMIFGLGGDQLAGSVVTVGTLLLSLMIDTPPLKEGQRAERKRLIGALEPESGEHASIFLAHCLVRWSNTRFHYGAKFGRADEPLPYERQVQQLLEKHFPLGSEDRQALELALEPWKQFDLNPGDLSFDDLPNPDSGWTLYLTGAEEWGDPDEEDLKNYIDGHFLVCGDWTRTAATVHAFKLVLGPAFAESPWTRYELQLHVAGRKDWSFDQLKVGLYWGAWWSTAEDAYYELLNKVFEDLSETGYFEESR